MAGRPPKGSAPAIRKELRVSPDLLADIEEAIAQGHAASFSALMEAGARLLLDQLKAKAATPKLPENK
jgi:hypothetical protein